MTIKNSKAEEFLPLTTTEFHILMALFNKELHGYGILQEIKVIDSGRQPGNTTLYRSISNLEDRSLVEEAGEKEDTLRGGVPRKYYRITPKGMEAARAEAQRISKLAGHATKLGIVPGAS